MCQCVSYATDWLPVGQLQLLYSKKANYSNVIPTCSYKYNKIVMQFHTKKLYGHFAVINISHSFLLLFYVVFFISFLKKINIKVFRYPCKYMVHEKNPNIWILKRKVLLVSLFHCFIKTFFFLAVELWYKLYTLELQQLIWPCQNVKKKIYTKLFVILNVYTQLKYIATNYY